MASATNRNSGAKTTASPNRSRRKSLYFKRHQSLCEAPQGGGKVAGWGCDLGFRSAVTGVACVTDGALGAEMGVPTLPPGKDPTRSCHLP